jgi:hypothetical protein
VDLAAAGTLTALRQRAMRTAYVGSLPTEFAPLDDTDFIELAASWSDLAAITQASGHFPWQAIGERWAELRWPGLRTIYAKTMSEQDLEFPELIDESDFSKLVDEVRPEFEKTPADAAKLLVWDHTRYFGDGQRSRTKDVCDLYQRFAFHRPISHPFHFGLGPSDGTWRLKEAACLQIGIIDERIWASRDKMAKDHGYNKLPAEAARLLPAWRRAGVHLLHELAVNLWSSEEKKATHPLLVGEADVDPRDGPYDFLVVHRGLIDKAATVYLEREKPDKERRSAADLRDDAVFEIMAWLRLACHRLIVTSGRGLEPAYRDILNSTGANFVEFSALADAVIDNTGDKVGLVRLLRSV